MPRGIVSLGSYRQLKILNGIIGVSVIKVNIAKSLIKPGIGWIKTKSLRKCIYSMHRSILPYFSANTSINSRQTFPISHVKTAGPGLLFNLERTQASSLITCGDSPLINGFANQGLESILFLVS